MSATSHKGTDAVYGRDNRCSFCGESLKAGEIHFHVPPRVDNPEPEVDTIRESRKGRNRNPYWLPTAHRKTKS